MTEMVRKNKLIVVADESGNIRMAMWPGTQTEGAPSQMGIGLSNGQVAHEVDVPDELYQSARPDLSGYSLRIAKGVPAVLVRRSTSKSG